MRGESAALEVVRPRQVNDERDIRRALQELFQDGAVKHDVPIQQDSPTCHLAFGAENRKQLSGLLIPIIVIIPNVGQSDGFLLIPAHDRNLFDVGLIERSHRPLEDGFPFNIQETLGLVLNEGQQLLFKSRSGNDGRDHFAADREKGLLIPLHLGHADDVIDFRQRDDAIIGRARSGVVPDQG